MKTPVIFLLLTGLLIACNSSKEKTEESNDELINESVSEENVLDY